MPSLGQYLFQLGYELSPIILTNGVATPFGGMLPIIAITQAANFTLGILNGTSPIDPNTFFGRYRPLPGGTLIRNESGKYPFANQVIAANAIIAKEKQISLLMEARANQPGAYVSKLVTFSALKALLDLHNQSGGTYTVATPAFIYTNCILLELRDVSRNDSNQPQSTWQWDFEQPLITATQADQTYTQLNSFLSVISAGVPQPSVAWSSIGNSLGVSPQLTKLFAGTANAIGSQVSTVASSITSALGIGG